MSSREHCDKVIFTGPVNVLQMVAARELLNVAKGGGDGGVSGSHLHGSGDAKASRTLLS